MSQLEESQISNADRILTSEEGANGVAVAVKGRDPAGENNEETQHGAATNNTEDNDSSADDSSGEESSDDDEAVKPANGDGKANSSDSDTGSSSDDENPDDDAEENPEETAAMTVENKPADKNKRAEENPEETAAMTVVKTAVKGMDVAENPENDNGDETADETAAKPVDETRFDEVIQSLSTDDNRPYASAWDFLLAVFDNNHEQSYLFIVYTLLLQSFNYDTINLKKMVFDKMQMMWTDKNAPTSVPVVAAFKEWINKKNNEEYRKLANERIGDTVDKTEKWDDKMIAALLSLVDVRAKKADNWISRLYEMFTENCLREIDFKVQQEYARGGKKLALRVDDDNRDEDDHPEVMERDPCYGLALHMPFHIPEGKQPQEPHWKGMTPTKMAKRLKQYTIDVKEAEKKFGVVARLSSIMKDLKSSHSMHDVFQLLKQKLCTIYNELNEKAFEKVKLYATSMINAFFTEEKEENIGIIGHVCLAQLVLSGNTLSSTAISFSFGHFKGKKEEEAAYPDSFKTLFEGIVKKNGSIYNLNNLAQLFLYAGSDDTSIKSFKNKTIKSINKTIKLLREGLNTHVVYKYAANSKPAETPKTKSNKKRNRDGDKTVTKPDTKTDTKKKKRKLKQNNDTLSFQGKVVAAAP